MIMSKGPSNQTVFVADTMLGKLAKWLRILGYDTVYKRFYSPMELNDYIKKRRQFLLSRDKRRVAVYPATYLVRADKVGEQLTEVREKLGLAPDRSGWFTRCLICNVQLTALRPIDALDRVPEYVYNSVSEIRTCPSCGRSYWPGTHKKRMLVQLEKWGFV